jgi:hypothetical protein
MLAEIVYLNDLYDSLKAIFCMLGPPRAPVFRRNAIRVIVWKSAFLRPATV